jgi:hypothetical protein
VFRGYLQPRFGACVKRAWAAVAIVGLIFTAVHFDAWTGPAMVYVAGFSAAFGIGGIRAGSIAPLCGLHAAHNAMEFLWFPHESNAVTTWPMADANVAALSIWIVWLFWTTRPRLGKALVRQDFGDTETRPNHALQRTRPSPPGCNRTPSWAGSLSLGR